MKFLTIISLLLSLSLIWQWFDHCGDNIFVGNTLPWCNACSTLTSVMRMFMLVVAGLLVALIIKRGQPPTLIYRPFIYPTHEIRIHWHRIALLIAILGFPLWIGWVDYYTDIPGPDEIWLTRQACYDAEVKASFLWFFEMMTIVATLYFLNRGSKLKEVN